MKMEQAYEEIGRSLFELCRDLQWDSAGFTIKLADRIVQISFWREHDGNKFEEDRIPSAESATDIANAARLIQSEMLKKRGDLIKTIAFELNSHGKFSLKFEYVE